MSGDRSVTASERDAEGGEHEKPRSRFTPGDVLRCLRCGLALHGAPIARQQALAFAWCCPRCDGPLPTDRRAYH